MSASAGSPVSATSAGSVASTRLASLNSAASPSATLDPDRAFYEQCGGLSTPHLLLNLLTTKLNLSNEYKGQLVRQLFKTPQELLTFAEGGGTDRNKIAEFFNVAANSPASRGTAWEVPTASNYVNIKTVWNVQNYQNIKSDFDNFEHLVAHAKLNDLTNDQIVDLVVDTMEGKGTWGLENGNAMLKTLLSETATSSVEPFVDMPS